MTAISAETVSVVAERDLPWPPENVWRALTQPHLIEEWLMKNDFELKLDHAFRLRAEWGHVDCRVIKIEADRCLVYTWAAFGVSTTVTWTLTPTNGGTHLKVEQAGFLAAPEHARFVQGAKHGWANFLDGLERVVPRDE